MTERIFERKIYQKILEWKRDSNGKDLVDADQEAMNKIINMLVHAKKLMESLSNRNGEK